MRLNTSSSSLGDTGSLTDGIKSKAVIKMYQDIKERKQKLAMLGPQAVYSIGLEGIEVYDVTEDGVYWAWSVDRGNPGKIHRSDLHVLKDGYTQWFMAGGHRVKLNECMGIR